MYWFTATDLGKDLHSLLPHHSKKLRIKVDYGNAEKGIVRVGLIVIPSRALVGLYWAVAVHGGHCHEDLF